MESARSVNSRLKVKTFTLNSKREIISKITREVLCLFKIELVGRRGEADYEQLSVINRRIPLPDSKQRVTSGAAHGNNSDAVSS